MTATTNAEIGAVLAEWNDMARCDRDTPHKMAAMLHALREANARTCVWSPDDDEYCPGTWDGACGAKWTFTEGGVVDNDMHYCPQCGGKVTVAAMSAQGEG